MRRTDRVAVAVLATLLVALSGGPASAALREPKVGLHTNLRQAFQGYTLFAPHTLTDTYLVDMHGKVVHTWHSDSKPALSVRLLDNGDLLRPARVGFDTPFDQGGHGGRVDLLDWNSNVVWSVEYASQTHLQHHDAMLLPNGHVLLIAWDRKTAEEAIAAGRNASLLKDHDLWPDSLVEIDPATNQVVWEWHLWDHLVQDLDPTKPNFGNPADEPGRVDVNYTTNGGEDDWTHANSLDYDPATDRILLSVRQFSEVWVIDHRTTTEEARGPRGDLLYRWGNPAAYGRGTPRGQQLFGQHDAEWIAPGLPGAGHILVFDNGDAKRRSYSTVEEIAPTLDGATYATAPDGTFLPATTTRVWPKPGNPRFFAAVIGGAQRLPNGDTLVTEGTNGRIIEVSARGRVVWDFVNPHQGKEESGTDPDVTPNRVFRAYRYAPNASALAGKGLPGP